MSLMVVLLLVMFQFKHFLADYPLQGSYMLKKFEPYPGFIFPLLAHAGVHAAMTAAIALIFKASWQTVLIVAGMDLAIHFIVDRIKASPTLMGQFKALSGREYMQAHLRYVTLQHWGYKTPEAPTDDIIVSDGSEMKKSERQQEMELIEARFKGNKLFWWALGWDQMMHHLTHYAIIFILLYAK